MASTAQNLRALDRLAQKSHAPRPHGFGGSAEGDLDLDPERIVMVPARKGSRAVSDSSRTTRDPRRRHAGVLGRLGIGRTSAR
jgi:hypothetical protein